MPTFIPALELNWAFYAEAVRPLLDGIPHTAARVGWGSEVLGFDSERSTDHGWGPQLQVFVDGADLAAARERVNSGLPETFRDWPVFYGWDDTPKMHHVRVLTLGEFLVWLLGFDASVGVETADWLAMPQQALLEVTRGAVYNDDTGAFTALRASLAYYPDDVWRGLIGAQWKRIAQEEAFVGRCAEVGDELGSAVVAARLSRDLMRMWFLFSREYAPYSKWFGTAFARLPESAPLGEALRDAIAARDYPSREAALVRAYEIVATKFNALGIAEPVDPTTRPYYGRPFQVLMADRFADACGAPLPFGAIDQWVDSTDVLSHSQRGRALRYVYES